MWAAEIEAQELLHELRNDRMRMWAAENEAQELLHVLMRKHNLKVYPYDDNEVRVFDVEKVKVKKIKADKPDDDNED
jgi:hypothetical protein